MATACVPSLSGLTIEILHKDELSCLEISLNAYLSEVVDMAEAPTIRGGGQSSSEQGADSERSEPGR